MRYSIVKKNKKPCNISYSQNNTEKCLITTIYEQKQKGQLSLILLNKILCSFMSISELRPVKIIDFDIRNTVTTLMCAVCLFLTPQSAAICPGHTLMSWYEMLEKEACDWGRGLWRCPIVVWVMFKGPREIKT